MYFHFIFRYIKIYQTYYNVEIVKNSGKKSPLRGGTVGSDETKVKSSLFFSDIVIFCLSKIPPDFL